MNSLTYISRQFDVLASTSTATIRSAPPSPVPNHHHSIHDQNTLSSSITPMSPSVSLPEMRTRRASQPSSSLRGRSKAQAFLYGPRRKALTVPNPHFSMPINPAEVPLPPSPPVSSVALPQSEPPPLPRSASGNFLNHRSPPSPASRRRRRRKTVSTIAFRPFVSIWHALLSAWLWLVGEHGPAKRRRLSSPVAGRIKHVRTEKPIASILREKAVYRDVNADEQSDSTLVDSDRDDDQSKRSTLVEIDGPDSHSHSSPPAARTPSSFGVPGDLTSAPLSGSILRQPPSSSLSQELASILRHSDSPTRIQIALPGVTEHSSDPVRIQRRLKTPWPSKERIMAPEGRAEPMRSTEDEEDEGEIDKVLMLRSKSPPTAPMSNSTPTSPSLSVLDLNVSSSYSSDSEKENRKQVDRRFPPRTIIHPPSSEHINPPEAHPSTEEPPFIPSPPYTSLPTGPSHGVNPRPSQALLPNRLGNSYLTASSSSRKSHRPSPDHTEAPASRQSARTKTPFHRPKTLVLDLDETLIHSTSSRISPPSSSSGGGSGGLFNELGGLFLNGGSGGGFGGMGLFSSGLLSGAGGLLGKGGDRARAGHMIEVVLNGRSTLYTVYKRPFVDYFLRKVKLSFFLLCDADDY